MGLSLKDPVCHSRNYHYTTTKQFTYMHPPLPFTPGAHGSIHLSYPVHPTPYGMPPAMAKNSVQSTGRPPKQMSLPPSTNGDLSVMVVRPIQGYGRHPLPAAHLRHHPHDGCLACRLGRPCTGPHSTSTKVPQRGKASYQYPRAEGSPKHLSRSPSTASRQTYTPHRQHDGSGLYKQQGWSQVSIPLPRNNPAIELVPTTQYHTTGTDNVLTDMLSHSFYYNLEWELHDPILRNIFQQ